MAFGSDDIIGAGLNIINKFIPDPAEQAKAAEAYRSQILAAAAASDAQQGQVNTAEAQHNSLFISGWRPMIGWVCALALAYQYVAKPLLTWALAASGVAAPPLPGLDGALYELLFGMLGLGSLRTLEKLKGVAAK